MSTVGDSDWRLLARGREIPTAGGYADQPNLLLTDDGAWLCVVTTGTGGEGDRGQRVIALRSTDRGRSWSAPVPLEPDEAPENSYAVTLKVPSGRIYAFYNFNADNLRELRLEDGSVLRRVDSQGHYVFRFSDDHGRSWSPRRYEIPIRAFRCDRENVYQGRIRFFWNVGKPRIAGNRVLIPHHKVGRFGPGFFAESEGAFLVSDNLLIEADPEKIVWQTLPEGEVGLKTPPGGGPVAEEQNLAVLSDGTLAALYRTKDGYPVIAYSRDGGAHWTAPEYLRLRTGELAKQPRAANFIWKCANGKFLYWFHNCGGELIREGWDSACPPPPGARPLDLQYENRNPGWLVPVREVSSPDGPVLEFGAPEVALYDDDPLVRISYPDLLEDGVGVVISETQKTVARTHELPAAFLARLWRSVDRQAPTVEPVWQVAAPGEYEAPELPPFLLREEVSGVCTRRGFSLVAELAGPGPVLAAARPDGRGLTLQVNPDGAIELRLDDGRLCCVCCSEPGAILPGRRSRLAVNVDGGAHLVVFVVNGRTLGGGAGRLFGWRCFPPTLTRVDFVGRWRVAAAALAVYAQTLLQGEAEWLTGNET